MRKLLFLLGLLVAPLLAGSAAQAQQTVKGQAVNSPTINGSVTIAAGNTFQQVLPALTGSNPARNSLTIQNNSTGGTDNCWVFIGPIASATKATAIALSVTQAYTRYFPNVPSDQISVTCTTTSDTVYVDTQ